MAVDRARLDEIERLYELDDVVGGLGLDRSHLGMVRELLPLARDGLRWREAMAAEGEVDAAARAAMTDNGCSCSINGDLVLCDDCRIPDGLRCETCSCKSMAVAAIAAAAAWRAANAPKAVAGDGFVDWGRTELFAYCREHKIPVSLPITNTELRGKCIEHWRETNAYW
jgi:hypothetical protein